MHRGFALSECPTSPSTGQRPLRGENSVVKKNMVGFLGLDSCGQEFTFIEGTEDWNWCGAKLLFDVTVRGLGPLNIRRSLPCIGMKS